MRFKDANECLQANLTPEAMAECVRNAEVVRPDKLKDIFDFENEIWEKFFPSGKEQMGLLLPWGNHFGSSLPFRFRNGEVTVWTGFNKHGKSEVLNHVIIDLCWQGEKAMICSLEVSAPETYRKLIRMAMGTRNVIDPEERERFREQCLAPLADKIWVYDHVGNASVEDVLDVMLYAYQRYGCRQFVLDSLMKFEGLDGDGQDIWIKQRDFMHKLLTFAATYGVHVHLVAHSKKPGDRKGEREIPRRYDIMGSSYISNLAFNVIVVWRNRAKQDRLEEIFQQMEHVWITRHGDEAREMGNLPWKRLMGGAPPREAAGLVRIWNRMLDVVEELPASVKQDFGEVIKQHDAYLIVDAQRGGDGDAPARHLWFEVDSLQFLEVSPWDRPDDPRARARVYVDQPPVEADVPL